jgi:hypothetical protein
LEVNVSSWKRTGRPVRSPNFAAKERMRAAKGLSRPSGLRGIPNTAIAISSSAQKRARSSRRAASLRRCSVARGVARRREASEVARPTRRSPKSTARIRPTGEE